MPTPANSLNITQPGLVVFDGVSVFTGVTLTAGAGVTITNGSGIAGNPVISLTGGSSAIESVLTDNGTATPTAGQIVLHARNNAGGSVLFSQTTHPSNTIILTTTDALSNTFIGGSAGNSTLLGTGNSGFGLGALNLLSSGATVSNCAFGFSSLGTLATGNGLNSAYGFQTLNNITSGAYNTALGFTSGSNYATSESSNIVIRNGGLVGESNVIRIGTQGTGAGQQNATFIAGIIGVTASNPVIMTINSSTGQLGVVATGNNGVLISSASGVPSLLAAGTTGQVLTATTGAPATWASPATSGTVTSVSGTANQVAVANGTTTPVISLIGPYTPSTYTAHGVLIGEGTSSIVALAAGTAGQILQSGGAAADPAYSTTTYPTTNAANTILYASSANVMAALATANNGTLITSGAGVPSISSTLPAAVQANITSLGNLGNQVNTTRTVFSALLSATDSNVTGDGTVYMLGSGNALTVTQQGSGMTTTGTFTAPVTGYYLFTANMSCTGSATATDGLMQFVVGGSAININRNLPKDLNGSSFNATLISFLTATQTVTFLFLVSGVTKTISVLGDAGNPTTVCGYLLT